MWVRAGIATFTAAVPVQENCLRPGAERQVLYIVMNTRKDRTVNVQLDEATNRNAVSVRAYKANFKPPAMNWTY